MRAEVRLKRRDFYGASQDLQKVQNSAAGTNFAPLVEAMRSGAIGCGNFLSPNNPLFQAQATEAPAITETPGQ
jgi:hypothetical protein